MMNEWEKQRIHILEGNMVMALAPEKIFLNGNVNNCETLLI